LSEEMRVLLRVSAEKLIPVASELQMCHAHLEVMSLRLDQSYKLETVGFDGTEMIPPLVFHTIIENGLTHGLAGHREGHFIIRKKRVDEQNVYAITNDGDIATGSGGGTGIKYVESRLEEAYPGRWRLSHGPDTEGYTTLITVPAELRAPGQSPQPDAFHPAELDVLPKTLQS